MPDDDDDDDGLGVGEGNDDLTRPDDLASEADDSMMIVLSMTCLVDCLVLSIVVVDELVPMMCVSEVDDNARGGRSDVRPGDLMIPSTQMNQNLKRQGQMKNV